MQLFDSNSLFFMKKKFTIIIVLFIVMHIGCATPQSISNSSNSQPTNPNSRALSNSPRTTSSTDSDNSPSKEVITVNYLNESSNTLAETPTTFIFMA